MYLAGCQAFQWWMIRWTWPFKPHMDGQASSGLAKLCTQILRAVDVFSLACLETTPPREARDHYGRTEQASGIPDSLSDTQDFNPNKVKAIHLTKNNPPLRLLLPLLTPNHLLQHPDSPPHSPQWVSYPPAPPNCPVLGLRRVVPSNLRQVWSMKRSVSADPQQKWL